MTIVRSLGTSTLVALMSAHRAAAGECEGAAKSFDQALIDSIEADLHFDDVDAASERRTATKPPRSYGVPPGVTSHG
jgi:hypothetical protein